MSVKSVLTSTRAHRAAESLSVSVWHWMYRAEDHWDAFIVMLMVTVGDEVISCVYSSGLKMAPVCEGHALSLSCVLSAAGASHCLSRRGSAQRWESLTSCFGEQTDRHKPFTPAHTGRHQQTIRLHLSVCLTGSVCLSLHVFRNS